MSVLVVAGAQWGDEGKGKIVDLLAGQAHMVARYHGGNNAGHTVVNDLGEFRLHLVPAGIFNPKVICAIGNGVVVDPKGLLEEIDLLASYGVDIHRLLISDRAHVVMPYHLLLDRLEEEARGAKALGTTGRGIGPAYVDKVGRMGIRMGDLLDPAVFREKLTFVLEMKNRIIGRLYGAEPLSLQPIYDEYFGYGQRLKSHITDIAELVRAAARRGENIILEGAQGALLDLDFGTYPYVTSSSSMVGAACVGVGLSPTQIDRCLGVFKAYSTRVGGGPLPTELTDGTGERLREIGQEYGATTGRPRRCGWFDAVAGRFTIQTNNFDLLAITRLDVLDSFPKVAICTGYRCDGHIYHTVPSHLEVLQHCQPVWEEHPGWLQPINEIRTFEALPDAAQRYLHRLEELLERPIAIVSVGNRREQTIIRQDVF
ncbi:MAG: adenylosuccinate synthase [Chloroflexi bacterium]|nr:adenylosuccinate synthase [Chloroflexota bacterium]